MCLSLLTEPADCDPPLPEKLAKTSPELTKAQAVQAKQLCSLKCGHIFHKKCALFWLKTTGKNGTCGCPICRENYQEIHIRIVYLPEEESGTVRLMKRVFDLQDENDELKNETNKLKKELEDHKKVEVRNNDEQEDQKQNNEKKENKNDAWWSSWR